MEIEITESRSDLLKADGSVYFADCLILKGSARVPNGKLEFTTPVFIEEEGTIDMCKSLIEVILERQVLELTSRWN